MFVARMLNLTLRPLRRIAGQGMRTRCARKGIEWDLDLDEGIDLCIYLLGAYEPRTLRAFAPIIGPGAVVLDIGANIGAHTLHFARLVGPAGHVYAFEPSDYACAKMRANMALNPELADRISLEQRFLVADGSEPLPPTVYSRWPVAKDHPDLNADHLGKPEALVGASAVTADDFCDGAGLQRLDFVKLDVDGHELQVLRGFRRGLERFRPSILVELAPFVYKGSRAAEFDDFVNFIANLGYSFTDARSGALISRDPAQLRRQITPGGSMNCLLIYPRSVGKAAPGDRAP
jgi:FkbM family methyltransferase